MPVCVDTLVYTPTPLRSMSSCSAASITNALKRVKQQCCDEVSENCVANGGLPKSCHADCAAEVRPLMSSCTRELSTLGVLASSTASGFNLQDLALKCNLVNPSAGACCKQVRTLLPQCRDISALSARALKALLACSARLPMPSKSAHCTKSAWKEACCRGAECTTGAPSRCGKGCAGHFLVAWRDCPASLPAQWRTAFAAQCVMDLSRDSCGIFNGDDSTCSDACGVPLGDNSTCTDKCGVVHGNDTTCSDAYVMPTPHRATPRRAAPRHATQSLT